MASKPIVLYTTETDDTLYVSGPELFDSLGITPEEVCGLQTHTIHLKTPFTQEQQDEVDRAVAFVNPANGVTTVDETKRAGATVEQYVASWDFSDARGAIPADASGYKRLHPLVAAELRNRLAARIFPSFYACPNFTLALSNKQRSNSASAPNSETEPLTSAPPQTA